uniref:Uncharacterized protein n=1 Tax=Myoviridae sp. ctZgq1 TaxID=2826666 RepID=A0A8S5LXN0_9CAUD|nr:MAG TPA: hypothetical protein [Myoviridae sp. ctZgq1]
MKKSINANQVVERNETLHTIELYESYTDINKKYLIATYSTITRIMLYVDVYTINDCLNFMNYLNNNNYVIDSIINC